MKSPCRFCEKRYLGCHDRCEDYKEYKQRIDVAREAHRDWLNAEMAVFESNHRRVEYYRKRHGRGRERRK